MAHQLLGSTGWRSCPVPKDAPAAYESGKASRATGAYVLPRQSRRPASIQSASKRDQQPLSERKAGLGDYAAKLEKARVEGRGTDPSQVNQLHPSAISDLRDRRGVYEPQAFSEANGGQEAAIEEGGGDDDWANYEGMQGGYEDEAFDEEDEEDPDEDDDPYGFNANVQELIDDPNSASMQFQDLAEADVGLPDFGTSDQQAIRQNRGTSRRTAWGNERPYTSSGSRDDRSARRGIHDVLEQRRARSRENFGATRQLGRDSDDKAATRNEGSGGGKHRFSQRPSNNAWLDDSLASNENTKAGGMKGKRQQTRQDDWDTGDDWTAGTSSFRNRWYEAEEGADRRRQGQQQGFSGHNPNGRGGSASSHESGEDHDRFVQDLRPRRSDRPKGRPKTEPVDFSRLLEMASQPSERQAEQRRHSKGPASAFYAAADALQARLAIGVEGERQEAIDAQRRVYARRSIKQLRSAGVVVTHLRGKHAGEVFSDFLWDFQLSSEANLDGATFEGLDNDPMKEKPASSAVDEVSKKEKSRLLPNHMFRKGDPVLIIQARSDGSLPNFERYPELREKHPALEAAIQGIGRSYIRVAVPRIVHEALQDAGEEQDWRMDKTVQEATVVRQLQAVALLDKPFAYLQHQEALQANEKDAKAEDNDARMAIQHGLESLEQAEAANREAGFYSKDFREGELRIRQILLGIREPELTRQAGLQPSHKSTAAILAERVPYWALTEGYQEEAKRLLVESFVTNKQNKLNKSQIGAISHSLSSTLSLWQGPPGTGKTRTLLGLLETFTRLSKWLQKTHGIDLGPILACADTNAATDNILEGLYARGVGVVRLGRPSNVREELHNATMEFKAQQHSFGKKALEKREEADIIYQRRRAEAAEFRASGGGDDIVEVDKFRKRQNRMERQARALEADARNLMLYAQRQVLQDSEVVTATCAGAGDTDILSTMRFSVVVLDEATQSTEPSTLIPLLRGAESVVMAGDPNQLPPTVISHTGRAASLDQPLFERLQETDIMPKLLDTQYRMHPAIAGFPSEMFYDGKLRSGIKASSRPAPKGFPWPNPDCPVALIECDYGEEHRGVLKAGTMVQMDNLAPGASSYFNLEEARLAVRAFEMLMTAHDAASGAIISPYNGQVKLLRNLVKQTSLQERVVVSSVDGYQGREADVIVFSAVRNNMEGRLGFVTDERRLNVAITRPRRGLVVVGSPLTLSADEKWRRWLDWVRDHGGFLAPRALQLTEEERAAGFFDPQIEKHDTEVASTEPGDGVGWDEWQLWDSSSLEPDNPDEQALASLERRGQEFDISSDWYT